MRTLDVPGWPIEHVDHADIRAFYPELQEQSNIASGEGAAEDGVLCLGMCPESMDRILPMFRLDALPDLRLIYLTREDILGHAISLAVARRSPAQTTDTALSSSAHEPEYAGDDIRRISEELLHNRSRWELYFGRNGLSPLRITYEDIVDRPQRVLESIAAYAGVTQPALGQDNGHAFQRETDTVSEAWRHRYISEHRNMQSLDVVGRGPRAEQAAHADEIRQHWAQAGNFDLSWNGRASMAVGFLEPDEKWICDIGCGPVQAVSALLPSDATYLAADLKQWSPHVALCDLNVPMLPEREMRAADVCLFLGVFEYVDDLPRALRAIAAHSDTLIFSYCSTDVTSERWRLWTNAYSGADIVNLLASVGFVVQKMVAYVPGQYVFRAKRLTAIPAETRLAARAGRLVAHQGNPDSN